MLVRSWNLFHGNTLPPDRRSHLEQMIRLAAADRPDVLCLQEVPLWALSRLAAWSSMSVQHVVTQALLGTWLGGVITRLNNGLFRSGLAGQANAILLAPGLEVLAHHKLRIDQHREEPRFCHAVRLESLVIGNLHATGALSQPEIAAAEILRAEAFVTGIAGAVLAATSTCGRTLAAGASALVGDRPQDRPRARARHRLAAHRVAGRAAVSRRPGAVGSRSQG